MVRPYAAESFIELGYVYTQSAPLRRGVEVLRKGDQLARTVPMEKGFEAAALRGLGSTLIELKNLPRARKAFRDSLRIEPMNRIAHWRADVCRRARTEMDRAGDRRPEAPGPLGGGDGQARPPHRRRAR